MLSQSGFFCRQDFKFDLPSRDGCFFASSLALISSRKPLCKGRCQRRKEQPTVFDALSHLGKDLRTIAFLHIFAVPNNRCTASSTISRCFHGAHNNNTFCASCLKNEVCYECAPALGRSFQQDSLVESRIMLLDSPSQDVLENLTTIHLSTACQGDQKSFPRKVGISTHL